MNHPKNILLREIRQLPELVEKLILNKTVLAPQLAPTLNFIIEKIKSIIDEIFNRAKTNRELLEELHRALKRIYVDIRRLQVETKLSRETWLIIKNLEHHLERKVKEVEKLLEKYKVKV